jgi:hypothetical protein
MALTLGACGTSSASASSSPKSVPCGPASARTLSASAVARVYTSGGRVFGCSKHGRRTLALGDSRSCLRATLVGAVVVTGELTAYGTQRCGVDTGFGGIVVRRLDTGAVLHNEAAVTGPVGVEGHTSVAAVVLKPDGSAAWIGTSRAIGPLHQGTEVHEVTATGSRLLDSGRGIDTASLRLRGSSVSWRHGTATRTATLR